MKKTVININRFNAVIHNKITLINIIKVYLL